MDFNQKQRKYQIQGLDFVFHGFLAGPKTQEIRIQPLDFVFRWFLAGPKPRKYDIQGLDLSPGLFLSPGGLRSKSARVSEFARSCAVFAAQGGALHWPQGEAEAVEVQ